MSAPLEEGAASTDSCGGTLARTSSQITRTRSGTDLPAQCAILRAADRESILGKRHVACQRSRHILQQDSLKEEVTADTSLDNVATRRGEWGYPSRDRAFAVDIEQAGTKLAPERAVRDAGMRVDGLASCCGSAIAPPRTLEMTLLALLPNLAAVIATWTILYLSITGIGVAAMRPLGVDVADDTDLADAFWLGLASLLFLLQTWHLFLRISGYTTVLLVVPGLLLLLRYRRRFLAALVAGPVPSRKLAAAIVVAVLWVALRSLGPVTLYDSGMYHLPYMEWARSYPIVAGLGNLHGRLAFHPAILLLAAAIDQGPWRGGSSHITNGLLVAAFTMHALWGARRIFQSRTPRPRDLFRLAVLPAVLGAALRQGVASLETDVPVLILMLVTTGLLLDLLVRRAPDAATRQARVSILLPVTAAAACVKLSAATYGLAATAVGIVAWLWPGSTERRVPRLRLRPLVLPVALGLVWFTNGAILSGYPLYPGSWPSLNVDWRVPAEQVAAEGAWIRMSARSLDTNRIVTDGDWLRPWVRDVLERGDLFEELLAPLAGIAIVLLMLATGRRRKRSSGWQAARWLTIPIATALAVWWIDAPSARLGQGIMWSLLGVLAAVWAAPAPGPVSPTRSRALLAGVAAMTSLFVLRRAAGDAYHAAPGERVHAAIASVLAVPDGGRWLGAVPEAVLTHSVTAGGVPVTVPIGDNGCWGAAPGCTPHPVPGLQYRKPDDPAGGFRIVGPWAPARWPNPWSPFLRYWRCTRQGADGPTLDRQRACRDAIGRNTTSAAGRP